MQSIGVLRNIEEKIKATGWVSPQWSIMQDLNPIFESVSGSVITPMLNRYIGQLDDATIPQMAHSIVDNAIKNGSLSLFDGKLELEQEDLEELKKLLNYNLPIKEGDVYEVKTE